MVTGIGILTTSVISGFLVAWGGMFATLLFALGLTAIAFVHLLAISIDEKRVAPTAGKPAEPKRIDIRGTIAVIAGVPGLFALIIFATFNNFLGGIFMALLDAYGLSLVSVQVWGLLFGVLSTAFIISGIVISRTGLGRNPLRTLLLVNLIIWGVCCVFTIHALDLAAGGRHVHLDAAWPLCRGVRAHHAAKGRAAGAPGPGLRLRPVGRAIGLAADRVPDRGR